jgi:hypothetical protein
VTARAELVSVLRAARQLAARPGNDFTWSSWSDADDAVTELDGHIATLEAGGLPPRSDVSVLFAATGPLQEVALSSGWSKQFLALAERFDTALAELY